MSRPRLRSIITLAAVLAAQAPRPGHAWSTGPVATPIPASPDYQWVRNLPTHEWIMWQAIQYLKRQGHPLADLFEKNFDSLARGNQYADHHCDSQSGIPGALDWRTDDRLGKEIVQTVELGSTVEATARNCADVVEHFPMRPEIGHVEEIWDDVRGDDLFAPAFDPPYYRAQNLDVETTCRTQSSPNVCAMAHWAREGRAQGRLGAALPATVGAADLGTPNDVVFSYAGAIPGMTCVSANEPADPDGWWDNDVCSVRDLGLRWSTSGPIAGMSCTPITEPVDPYTWNDNYLCAPSSLGFAWSSAGRIAGKRCTQFLEPGDPHTWSDNYLCHSLRTSARRW